MKSTTIDKIAMAFVLIGALLVLGFVLLIGWGFIELVQWVVSK